jgi:hypothetical protein
VQFKSAPPVMSATWGRAQVTPAAGMPVQPAAQVCSAQRSFMSENPKRPVRQACRCSAAGWCASPGRESQRLAKHASTDATGAGLLHHLLYTSRHTKNEEVPEDGGARDEMDHHTPSRKSYRPCHRIFRTCSGRTPGRAASSHRWHGGRRPWLRALGKSAQRT